ncbi:glycosyltransferase [Sphingomonadaceae bacterium jetA1]|jgi:glycosyltransferase involved in cell wall biosynthesis|uniref:glycosyltransferase n=1 Tax=Facivitalis istanbulensis TaxID=3075838 RepID=UPI003473CF38
MPADHILTYALAMRGGVEAALGRMLGGWIAQGRRVSLILGEASGSFQHSVPPGVETTMLGHQNYAGLAAALPGLVAQARPDIIFCPGNHYTAMAAWTRLRLARSCPPIVAKMSNAAERGDHHPLFAWGQRQWLARHPQFLDALVAMTPATARAAQIATGLSVAVIPNPPSALPAATVDRGASPGSGGPRHILGVGRLEPQKRWDRLITAMTHLPPDVTLTILGEGSLRPALTAQIDILGLADRVSMPGHAADAPAAMAAAQVLALPSDYEGVPGVLREALAVGTPVVATDSSPAVREIVRDASLGSVVARDDLAGLVAALRHWVDPVVARPAPVPQPGQDSARRYLALFDSVVATRAAGSAEIGFGPHAVAVARRFALRPAL